MGKEYTYISTGHTGLYEKYGYEFFKTEKDVSGGTPGYTANVFLPTKRREAGYVKSAADGKRKS